MNILIIEDDANTAAKICSSLRKAGHKVDHVDDGISGMKSALQSLYEVLIIDRMLPYINGFDIVTSLRKKGVETPVLFLSALGEVSDRVDGLKAGADDYLIKPYDESELLARVEVLARRKAPSEVVTMLVVSDLEMDIINRSVRRGGKRINLQPREYKLLEYLMRNSGQLITRTMLLENVWEYHFDPQTNVIDVHISRLRSKIDKDFDELLLKTIRGSGYMLGSNKLNV